MILIGAGGHAKVVLDAALLMGTKVEVLLDDNPPATRLWDTPVVRRSGEWSLAVAGKDFLVSIGDDHIRARLFADLVAAGGRPVNVLHPRACVSPRASFGRGVFVAALAVVNPGAAIGDDCILNTSCSVDHDCVLGPHVHVCPGARLAGQVSIGALTMVGTGASILPGVRVGEDCRIGAGAVVTRDVPDHSVVAGVPAREVGRHVGSGR